MIHNAANHVQHVKLLEFKVAIQINNIVLMKQKE